jgi:hypothetical protein
LTGIATRLNLAVIGVTHFRKDGKDGEKGRPLDRLLGSGGFAQLARIVLATARRKDGGRALVRVKSNHGPDGGAFTYALARVPVPGWPNLPPAQIVEWGQTLEGDAADLVARFEKGDSKRGNAAAWLWKQLRQRQEPVLRSELLELAEAEIGISERTLERARAEIGAVAVGGRRGIKWFLPNRLKEDIEFPAPQD